jgi:c(7)-type cytochrome triheme protein
MERRVRQAWWIWMAVIGGTLCLGMSALAGQMRLPKDLIYSKSAGSPGKVVFSHEFHVGVADKCTSCHSTVFRMLRPSRTVTHTEMDAGRSCGICHNGSMAFGPGDPATCARCHGAGGKTS